MKIVILEDNEDRQKAMRSCLLDRFHQYEIVFFDHAAEMCAYLKDHLESVLLICLDHDLELKQQKNGTLSDPGTGRELADFLSRQPPSCPIIIHTTNSAAGDGMEFLLQESRWQTHRVYPYGDLEWIPAAWFKAVRNAIVGMARPRAK